MNEWEWVSPLSVSPLQTYIHSQKFLNHQIQQLVLTSHLPCSFSSILSWNALFGGLLRHDTSWLFSLGITSLSSCEVSRSPLRTPVRSFPAAPLGVHLGPLSSLHTLTRSWQSQAFDHHLMMSVLVCNHDRDVFSFPTIWELQLVESQWMWGQLYFWCATGWGEWADFGGRET